MKQRDHFIVDADIYWYTHRVWKNVHPTSNYRIRDETIVYAAFDFWYFSLKNMIFLNWQVWGKPLAQSTALANNSKHRPPTLASQQHEHVQPKTAANTNSCAGAGTRGQRPFTLKLTGGTDES